MSKYSQSLHVIHAKKQTRGVALITVLFLTVFLVMLGVTVVGLTMAQLHHTQSFYQHQAAVTVANSGVNYAMARLMRETVWLGYESTDEPTLINSTCGNSTVIEHYISPDGGCIEGAVITDSGTGYFDFYFAPNADPAMMHYFGDNKPAGPMPDTINLCVNNLRKTSTVDMYDSHGNPVPGRKISSFAGFLTVRGTCRGVSRTIETSFTQGLNSRLYDSVLSGGGKINILHTGKGPNEKIRLKINDDGKQSILRSVGTMTIGLDLGSTAFYPTNDYLELADSLCRGHSEVGDPAFNPLPLEGTGAFTQQDDQKKHIPKLKFSDLIPDTTGFNSIPAGTYTIVLRNIGDPEYPYPKVLYYNRDTPPPYYHPTEYPFTDASSTFKTHFLNNKMEWDSNNNKLILKDSFKVTTAGSLQNLNFVPMKGRPVGGQSDRYSRIQIQIGKEIPDDDKPPVYLVNNLGTNSSIKVNGQLAGTGTVICTGNLDMEAESQLAADPENGISLLAGGTITVDGISQEPTLPNSPSSPDPDVENYNLMVSAYNKINQEINRQLGEGGLTVSMTYGQTEIPLSILTPQEKTLVTSIFTLHDNQNPDFLGVDITGTGYLVTSVDRYSSVQRWFTGSDGIHYDEFFGEWRRFHRIQNIQRYIEKVLVPKLPEKQDEDGRKIFYKDSVFKGLVYAYKDFKVLSPLHAFAVQGGLVALGGDLDGNFTGTDGNITINATNTNLKYDSQYLRSVFFDPTGSVEYLYWSIR